MRLVISTIELEAVDEGDAGPDTTGSCLLDERQRVRGFHLEEGAGGPGASPVRFVDEADVFS